LIERGVGFGDGRHETTQLCLLALGYLLKSQISPDRMLDFGAGNGILGIAAALRGVKVECVEIDENALNEARRNAGINALDELFDFRTHLSTSGTRFELIAANILVSVLLSFADELTTRLTPNGHLILSGLTSTDVPSILSNYRSRLPNHTTNLFERGAWRAVIFSPKR
jgi:ribosomal protein L11 methyltransferase